MVNSKSIAQARDDAIRSIGINGNSLCFLLSDAAKHMLAAGATLKVLYSKLFYVTGVVHSVHSCAVKLKSHSEDVHQLIVKVKLITVKNKIRQVKFSAIGCQPQPVVTKWGRWFNSAIYHVKNLSEIKAIVQSFKGSGILAA